MVLTPAGLRFRGRLFPCAIGKSGISTTKREGDGATPAGLMRITGLWYRPDRLAAPTDWARPIGPGDLWCDDADHPGYNRHARAPLAASHERLRRADPLYDLVITTDWNAEGAPGRGSAIFLHQWRRPRYGTEGCIAFARHDLRWIARHAPPGTAILVPALAQG